MRQTLLAILLAAFWVDVAYSGDLVKYSITDTSGSPVEIAATLTLPATTVTPGAKGAAVVLIHSRAGWKAQFTQQYARALGKAGFLVLEPRLFAIPSGMPENPGTLLPAIYGALRFLADREDVDSQRIGLAGFSIGGLLTVHAGASWSQEAYAGRPDLKFAAHAPFYPLCWVLSSFAQGLRSAPTIPPDAFTRWTGAPVRIFAGGRDDYDDKDPGACAEFISRVPAPNREAFSVQLYPEATHAWDQENASYYEKIACKGKGCTNTNVADNFVTRKSIPDLVAFFRKTLGVSP